MRAALPVWPGVRRGHFATQNHKQNSLACAKMTLLQCASLRFAADCPVCLEVCFKARQGCRAACVPTPLAHGWPRDRRCRDRPCIN
ncbi:hypothetical protein PSAC2689_40427 [Paraburkholderia sacchari]